MPEISGLEGGSKPLRRSKLLQDSYTIQQQLGDKQPARSVELARNRLVTECLRRLQRFRHKKGAKNKARFQMFAFNLYCCKPQIYRHLKSLLDLPSESFLQNYKLYLPPKFEECILYFLSSKLSSLKDEANHFLLCVDRIQLNRNIVYDTKRDVVLGFHNVNGVTMIKPAVEAYVIMLRSLKLNWVQPVIYAFVSASESAYPQVGTLCVKVISSLLEMGIQVEAIVTRPDSILGLHTSLNAGARNHFNFRDKKVYELHDLRILLNAVKNCLIENDFYYNEARISWHYIKLLYYHYTESELIPAITEADVHPNGAERARWRGARRVFSARVHAALRRAVGAGALPHEAGPTADFVQAMNELYELAAYGPQSKNKLNIEHQIEILERATEMFVNINMRSGDTVPRAILHMRSGLSAMTSLLRRLAERGFRRAYLTRLNKAPLDAFFRAVPRSAAPGGRRLKPTASQVLAAFAAAFARGLRRPVRGARRENLWLAARSGLLDERRVPRLTPPRSPLRLPFPSDRYRIEVSKAGAELYVTSFLLYQCTQVHMCPALKSSLGRRQLLSVSYARLKSLNRSREFWDRLLLPPAQLVQYVGQLERQLPALLRSGVSAGPGRAALRALARSAGALPCACFPRALLLKLFVRLRLWLAVNYTNRQLRLKDKNKHVGFAVPRLGLARPGLT